MTITVEEAVSRELRVHELPVTISGYLIATAGFSYIVSSLENENSLETQPAILLNTPEICKKLLQILPDSTGGLAMFQEACVVSGILATTGLSVFERCLYRISELVVYPQGLPPIILNDFLFD